jgi:hypothetical protein
MLRVRRGGRSIVALTAACLSLAACADTPPTDSTAGDAAKIEDIAGSALKRVTLTATAAKRLDLQTGRVRAGGSTTQIPYSAVLYDPDGHTWAFAETAPRSFVREPISVATIASDVASLTAGPPVGTEVVIVGAEELYGAEIGVGDE